MSRGGSRGSGGAAVRALGGTPGALPGSANEYGPTGQALDTVTGAPPSCPRWEFTAARSPLILSGTPPPLAG